MNKKIYTLILIPIFNIVFFNMLVEAHFVSSMEEWTIGKQYIAMFESNSNVVYTSEDKRINFIVNDLVYPNNSEINWFDYPKHKRYLSPITLVKMKDGTMNAFTFPGGFIYITTDMVDFLNATNIDGIDKNYGKIRPNSIENIYNSSNLQYVLAHEISHWKNQDWLRSFDKQYNLDMITKVIAWANGQDTSMTKELAFSYLKQISSKNINSAMSLKEESQADISAMQLIENVFRYSNGSSLSFFERVINIENSKTRNFQKDTDSNNLNPHPETDSRYKAVIQYLKENSNGRVIIEPYTGKLRFDGNLWYGTGYAPARDDVTAKERTYWIAGQLESIIHTKEINAGEIYISNISAIAPANYGRELTGPDTVISFQAPSSNKLGDKITNENARGKLIDKFDINYSQTRDILHGKTKAKTVEEKYFLYVLNTIKDISISHKVNAQNEKHYSENIRTENILK